MALPSPCVTLAWPCHPPAIPLPYSRSLPKSNPSPCVTPPSDGDSLGRPGPPAARPSPARHCRVHVVTSYHRAARPRPRPRPRPGSVSTSGGRLVGGAAHHGTAVRRLPSGKRSPPAATPQGWRRHGARGWEAGGRRNPWGGPGRLCMLDVGQRFTEGRLMSTVRYS